MSGSGSVLLMAGGRSLDLARPLVMAILNVTPDSFSDGGVSAKPDDAVAAALTFEMEGADIVDVGAESTRPGHTAVSPQDELHRLLPVLDRLVHATGLPISVDTYRASTAAAALRHGASIINDIWGLSRDPDMTAVVAEHRAAVIVMHNREACDASIDIVSDMDRFFDRAVSRAVAAGISPGSIVLDPGIGFGKTLSQNLQALDGIDHLVERFRLPVLVGASRKSFIDAIHRSLTDRRLGGTLAAHLHAVRQGARILRVHDCQAHVQALAVARALADIGPDIDP